MKPERAARAFIEYFTTLSQHFEGEEQQCHWKLLTIPSLSHNQDN